MAKAEAVRKALEGGTDPKNVAEDFKMPNVVLIDVEPRKVRHRQLSRPHRNAPHPNQQRIPKIREHILI